MRMRNTKSKRVVGAWKFALLLAWTSSFFAYICNASFVIDMKKRSNEVAKGIESDFREVLGLGPWMIQADVKIDYDRANIKPADWVARTGKTEEEISEEVHALVMRFLIRMESLQHDSGWFHFDDAQGYEVDFFAYPTQSNGHLPPCKESLEHLVKCIGTNELVYFHSRHNPWGFCFLFHKRITLDNKDTTPPTTTVSWKDEAKTEELYNRLKKRSDELNLPELPL